jgi:membrane protein DedA with SNARE-associated domain
MYELFLEVVEIVESWGYLGIFIMTFIESTFVPIPAEITLIPAGFLVSKGEMNFLMVWLVSVLGTVGGSLLNYTIAYHFGRKLLIDYGKYFFMRINLRPWNISWSGMVQYPCFLAGFCQG